ncbi:hypothetical protein ZWY2020_057481, partial [Hordeum vulgare]
PSFRNRSHNLPSYTTSFSSGHLAQHHLPRALVAPDRVFEKSLKTFPSSSPCIFTSHLALAIRWLLEASQKRPGQNMAFKLSSELVDAAKGSGGAIRKKEVTHRMAEANRALAHFR